MKLEDIGRVVSVAATLAACTTMGSNWMAQPLPGDEDGWQNGEPVAEKPTRRPPSEQRAALAKIGEPGADDDEPLTVSSINKIGGKTLGSFRNTYYDFPGEADFEGDKVALKNARCNTIKEVARGFYEAVCVQGSGTLSTGATVSFAKRDCNCAPICPRTQQHICFDELDAKQFPWGRGAAGLAITPLLTIAADTNVIPMGSAVYIPEYDGVPRDPGSDALHDGCFIVQDRGVRVTGKHVDVFTGHRAVTELWNRLVPSNKGVTIVLQSPRCARASESTSELSR
jgi:3D (Asp-Asp-Asp) domain-containing protein